MKIIKNIGSKVFAGLISDRNSQRADAKGCQTCLLSKLLILEDFSINYE